MQTIGAYKETIVFVSCATLLVGTVLVLQSATTPSRHRRRAPSSASRSGTAARSASYGGAGARSRSSSRPHKAPKSHTHNSAVLATATAFACSHASKTHEPLHAHGHRHHAHPRSSGPGPGGATSCSEDVHANPPQKLTVDAVAQHKKSLGTANALQGPKDEELAGIPARHRGFSSTCYRLNGGSRSGEEGGYIRSASNAATVGSQAPYPASSITIPISAEAADTENAPPEMENAAEEMSPHLAPEPTAESLRRCPKDTGDHGSAKVEQKGAPQPTTAPAPVVSDAVVEDVSVAGKPKRQTSTAPLGKYGSATQTNPQWFCEDGGTQTETSAAPGSTKMEAEVEPNGPCSWTTRNTHQPPAKEAKHAVSPNWADLGSIPLQKTETPMSGVVRVDKLVGSDACLPERETAVPTVVPLYFLEQLEHQLRLLVDVVTRDEWSEQAWMSLYVYLSKLPPFLRESLASRDRCGAATVAELLEKRKADSLCEGNRVEGAVDMLDENAKADLCPSLEVEVLHLLEHGTPIDPDFHFESRGSTAAYVKGLFDEASCQARECQVVDSGKVNDLVGFQLPSPALPTTSPLLRDEEVDKKVSAQGEEKRHTCILAFLAAHIKKYSTLQLRVAATQFPESGAEVPQPSLGVTTVIQGGADALPTPLRNGQIDAQLALPTHHRGNQDQLASLLESFVRLRQTPLFQALRHTSQHALFACDFIELASEAERLLERRSASPDASLMLHVPTSQKRTVTDATDAHDTSLGPSASVGSESTPVTSSSARHSIKVHTPMKPSIRQPIHRTLPSSPPMGELSSRRSWETSDPRKRSYPVPVHVGEE
ncbi:hypothetical protein JKF63_02532 [Porcisia hertigi]|uniref:Uncharacterized protein n=1 Tax=Porcisia hertigi TaxID=2761500 RepID=A0A836HN97_9TRYP|nr:hypothetical protein JKF63_02532 [Porcisia hertigi]